MSNVVKDKAALFGKPSSDVSSSLSSSVPTKGKTLGLTASLTAGVSPPAAGKTGAVSALGVTLSPEMKAKKIEEGRELSEKGMKCLKVTVFQWKADHLLAAPYFEQSSNAYRAAGELDLARIMMVQSAASHRAYGASSTAAVALLNAAKIAQTQRNSTQAASHFKESAELWGEYGDTNKCADVLAQAAKELEGTDASEALTLYTRAMDIVAPEDLTMEQLSKTNVNLRDILRDAFKFCLRGGDERLKQALVIAKRMAKTFEAWESQPSMCKSMAAVTIIQLALKDVVSADQTYLQEHLSNKTYIMSNECKVVDKFLLAYKNNDLDLLDDAQKGDSLFFLDPEIQPIARHLSLFSARALEAQENAENKRITRELKQLAMSTASTATELAELAEGGPEEDNANGDDVADEGEPDLC